MEIANLATKLRVGQVPAALPTNVWFAWVLSLRPYQWPKNLLVFGGLIFSRSLLDEESLFLSCGAFVAFCLASSGVYLLNDVRDLEADRTHPVKRFRPLAAGLLSPTVAWVSLVALFVLALGGAVWLHMPFAAILGTYVLVSIAYSFGLKQVAMLDVMVLTSGFVLRALGGTVVIGVQASPWLLLCTSMLALFVSFGKRRHELLLLQGQATAHRVSLKGYTHQLLDVLMAMSGAAAVVMYSLYTLAEETRARVGSDAFVLTVPFVLYGIFRYLYLVHLQDKGDDPAHLLATDSPTLVNILLWVLVACFILYLPASRFPFWN